MPELTRPAATAPLDLARARRLLRRSRWPRILLVAATALVLGGLVEHERARAVTAASAWGAGEAVWVATRELPAGVPIDETDVERRILPRGALPSDAVHDSPVDLRLRDAVTAGEILRSARLTGPEVGLLAARLPAGTGGVQLRTVAPHLGIGDIVDLHTLLDGIPVTRGAEVVGIDDDVPTVAVVTADIDAVIRAFTTGDVVPVVVG